MQKRDYLTIADVCEEFSISTATCKNWVRLGKLISSETKNNSLVFDKDYIKSFMKDLKSDNITALKSRRNKNFISGNKLYNSYLSQNSKNLKPVQEILDYIKENNIELKDNKISEIISVCAIQLINNSPEYLFLAEDISKNYKNSEFKRFHFEYIKNEDTLGLLYISLKNFSERKSKGAYYTPTEIVEKLCSNLGDIENKTIFDPCCGTGNFLLRLPDNLDFKNIYGNDIDPVSTKITRLNMALKFGITDRELLSLHITNHDFFSYNDKNRYDYIIGNPPWGRGRGKCDIYSDMFETAVDKSLSLLKQNGILAFVLPESILNVKSHKKIRKVISETNSIKYLEYLGNIFDGVQCPSVIIKILYDNKPMKTAGMVVVKKDNSFMINIERKVDENCFNFFLTDEEYKILEKIENIPNKITLKNQAKFGLGIVTGDNKKYITNKKTDENEMVLKGVNINKFWYEQSDNYISFTPEKFQQVAPTEIYRAKEKLIYKFISKELVFAYDNRQTLPLNSCNVLIPKIKDIDIKYILAILNSSVAQFYFRNKYNSLKVLRSHIESIPIPVVDKKVQQEIIFEVDRIIKNKETSFNSLDKKIEQIYGVKL